MRIMMDFFVYILKCNDKSYYVGHTDCIERRIAEHNEGIIECYTKSRLPVEMVFLQGFATRIEAIEAEQKIKNWSRDKKKAFIEGNWDLLSLLAKKKFDK